MNINVFYKLTVSFLLVIARYVQSTQNSKFVIYWQYISKKKGRDHAIILVGMARHPQITQSIKFAKFEERSGDDSEFLCR